MNNISFIIPAYNCADTIEEAIKSVFNQNFLPGDEIIIINDASTDKTLEVINKLRKKHPEIRLINHKLNKGSAAASRNTGIESSTNDLIFCLDSDNVLERNSVHKLKKLLLKKKADAAAFGEIYYFKKNINKIEHKWKLLNIVTLYDAINKPMQSPCGSGNYLYRKSSWIKCGRYNEGFGGAHDSLAFGLYQLISGSKMITLPHTHYFHRYGYNSTYVQESKKLNTSLRLLQILIPYIYLFKKEDVDKLFSSKYRTVWFDMIIKEKFELRLNDKSDTYFLKKIINAFLQKIK